MTENNDISEQEDQAEVVEDSQSGDSQAEDLKDEPTAPKAEPIKRSKAAKPEPPKHRSWGGRWIWIAIIMFAIAVLYLVREILLPFILAIVIAYILAPVVTWIHSKRIAGRTIPRWVAVIIIYFVGFIVIYSFSIIVMPRFYAEFVKLGQEAPGFFQKVTTRWIPDMNSSLQGFIETVTKPMEEAAEKAKEEAKKDVDNSVDIRPVVEGPESEDDIQINELNSESDILLEDNSTPESDIPDAPVTPLIDVDKLVENLHSMSLEVEAIGEKQYRVRFVPDMIPARKGSGKSFDFDRKIIQHVNGILYSSERYMGDLVALGQGVIKKVIASLMTLVLTLMLAAFILFDTDRIMGFFRSLTPPHYREEYDSIMTGIDKGLGGVIRGQLIICLVNGTLTGAGLLILGVKYAVILAVLASVFSLIPIFGTILSSIPSVGIGLTQSLTLGFLVLIWIVIIHLIEANILNPKIMGTSAKIHPALVVFALVAGEYTYGLFGALLAVPVFSIFQTIFMYFWKRTYRE